MITIGEIHIYGDIHMHNTAELQAIQERLNEALDELTGLKDERDLLLDLVKNQETEIKALQATQLTAEQEALLASIQISATKLADIVKDVPVDTAPVDTAPVDTAPVDPAPVDPAPVDPAPVDTAPVDPAPLN